MSFPRAGIKRFNDIKGCAPPVGAYDPKEVDVTGAGVAFDKSDRFKAPKDMGSLPGNSMNTTQLSNISSISCEATTPTKMKKQFSTSTPNLLSVNKKGKQTEKPPTPADPATRRELEKEIKKLLKERVEQDRILEKKEEELKKLDAKFRNTLLEKNSLQTKTVALEKQLVDIQKGNDVLKTKISAAEGSLKKQENLQAEVNSLKSQIAVKEGEATRLRQELDTSVNELLDCLYLSLETANVLKEREDLAGDLADLRANNLGILEKLKLANLKVKILKEEVERVVEEANHQTIETSREWESKYTALTEEKRLVTMAMDLVEENLESSNLCRKSLQETREALEKEVACLEATVEDLKSEKWNNEEEIRHLKGLLFAESDGRKVESQTVFESTAEKAEMEEKIDLLEESNEELNKNIRQMTEKYQTLESLLSEEQSNYESHVGKLETQLDLSKQDVHKLQEEVEDLQQKNKNYITELGEEKAMSDQKVKGLEEELSGSRSREAVIQGEVERLGKELSELMSELHTCKQQVEDGNSREKKMHDQVQELEAKISSLQTETAEIQESHVLATEELQEKLNQTEQQYTQLQEQHSRFKVEACEKEADLQKCLEEAESVKVSLGEKCARLEGTVQQLSEQQQGLSQEKTDLLAQVDQAKTERDTLCEANLALHTKLALSEQARDHLNTANEELERDFEQVRRHSTRMEESCARLEERVASVTELEEELISERAELSQQVDRLTDDVLRAGDKCTELEARLSDKTAEGEELTEANARLQEELVKSMEVKQAISDRFVQLENKMIEADQRLVDLNAINVSLQEKLDQQDETRVNQAEELSSMKIRLEEMTSEIASLNKDRTDLQAELLDVQQQKIDSPKQLEELETKLEEEKSKTQNVITEKHKLQEELRKLSEENERMVSNCTEMKERLSDLETERETLMNDKAALAADLSKAQEEIENNRMTSSEVDQNSFCPVEERDRLVSDKEELAGKLEEALKKNSDLIQLHESLEERLVKSSETQQKLSNTLAQLEKDCEARVEAEGEKFAQIQEQYEQQVEVLRQQLSCSVPQDEVESLVENAERWKIKYEDLLTKVEPFMEQIDSFEMEKQALLGMNKDAQNEVQKLSRDYAKLLGHQNQKQKIKHILKLKEENNSLKMEVSKSREQAMKTKRTIQRLEDKIQSLEKRKGKFDPSKAFQGSSKENDPKTPQRKLSLDGSERHLPSPLANRNAKFRSPIQNGLGNRL